MRYSRLDCQYAYIRKYGATFPPNSITYDSLDYFLTENSFITRLYRLRRGYLRFDLSTLGAKSYSRATLQFQPLYKKTDDFQFQVQILHCPDWYPIGSDDWGTGTQLLGSINSQDIVVDQWIEFDLLSQNLEDIITFEVKMNNETTQPTGENYAGFYAYLDVYYHLPLYIGGIELEYSKSISFDFKSQLEGQVLDSGFPKLQAFGGGAKRFRIQAIAPDIDTAFELVDTIREAQLAKKSLAVSGLPHEDWDGNYYISVSGSSPPGSTTIELDLVEAT